MKHHGSPRAQPDSVSPDLLRRLFRDRPRLRIAPIGGERLQGRHCRHLAGMMPHRLGFRGPSPIRGRRVNRFTPHLALNLDSASMSSQSHGATAAARGALSGGEPGAVVCPRIPERNPEVTILAQA